MGGLPDVQEQSALFRLTYSTEMLKNPSWTGEVQNSGRWHKVSQKPPVRPKKPIFYVTREARDEEFDDAGKQVRPVEFFVDGNTEQFTSVMMQHQLYGQLSASDRRLYCLIPAQQKPANFYN
ncbi:DUF2913 family protein [Morganella morganii]|uniref:DUF2913 family protein n=1 Tax=Morganella morganii TaxID=582 RepID=UPI001880C21F|nr:DUF2913 family protein [Morganella morganii]